MSDEATTNRENASKPDPGTDPEIGGSYSKYVLVVLTLVYVFNFIDRNILAILAQEIKADIGLTDAQLGFLYGTAFAVFYAIFGIPLGRLADIWVRRKLIAVGLAFWSAMTALSGTARSFLTLGTYRIGVGVGEASASPAAYSMLCDYFPPRLRATAMSIYSSGIYIGAGIGVFLGGWVVDGWNALFPAGDAPFRTQSVAGGILRGRPSRPHACAVGVESSRARQGSERGHGHCRCSSTPVSRVLP